MDVIIDLGNFLRKVRHMDIVMEETFIQQFRHMSRFDVQCAWKHFCHFDSTDNNNFENNLLECK